MAKKSRKNKFENDEVGNDLIKKYGDVIESGTKVLEDLKNFKVIGISPALDIALGGGLREGSCTVMTGDPKTGKTTTALYFAAKAQAEGKFVVYLNTEGRLTKENFTGIEGLDPSKIQVMQTPPDGTPLSAEKYLGGLERYIKSQPDLVAIVDSTSNMVPQDELDGEIRTGVRNALPRLLSMFFKRISGEVAKNKAILIFITHNIANTGGSRWSPAKMSDCGNMLQYQAGTNMVITHRGKWETADGESHIGQIANWLVKTSASGGIPNSSAQSFIRYGIGIDEVQEISMMATEFGMISKAGAWYTIDAAVNNKDHKYIKKILKEADIDVEDNEALTKFFKFQGMAKLTSFLEEHQPVCDLIYSEIREMLS